MHEVDGLPDGGDALEVLLGDRDVEALLEGHHELDQVEAVGVEVLLEAGVLGDGVGVDAEHLDGHLAQRSERLVAFHRLVPPECGRSANGCCAGGQWPMPEAAVDGDDGAGDVAGRVGAEEGDDGRHLLGRAEPAEGHRRRSSRPAAPRAGASVMAVTIGPGATTLQVMPRDAELPGDGPGEADAGPALAAA